MATSICFIVSTKKSLLFVKKQIINYNNKILLSSYGKRKKNYNHTKTGSRVKHDFIHCSYPSETQILVAIPYKSQNYTIFQSVTKRGYKDQEVKMSVLKGLKSYLTLRKFYNHDLTYFYSSTVNGKYKTNIFSIQTWIKNKLMKISILKELPS